MIVTQVLSSLTLSHSATHCQCPPSLNLPQPLLPQLCPPQSHLPCRLSSNGRRQIQQIHWILFLSPRHVFQRRKGQNGLLISSLSASSIFLTRLKTVLATKEFVHSSNTILAGGFLSRGQPFMNIDNGGKLQRL